MKEKPASTEVETGSGLTRKFQEEIRLEAVTKADVYGVGGRIPFVSSIVCICISLILHVGVGWGAKSGLVKPVR